MTPEVYAALYPLWVGAGKPREGWMFPAEKDPAGHISQGSMKNYHARAIRAIGKLGVQPFCPYVIRHTALTRLAKYTDLIT